MSFMLHFKETGPRIVSTLGPLHALHPIIACIFQHSYGKIRGIDAS